MGSERRKHHRMAFSGRATVVMSRDPKEYGGQINNVSTGGMNILTEAPCKFGELVEVRFRFGPEAREFRVVAQVMWVVPMDASRNVGVGFKQIDEETKRVIDHFLEG